jgi:hypothetical protein
MKGFAEIMKACHKAKRNHQLEDEQLAKTLKELSKFYNGGQVDDEDTVLKAYRMMLNAYGGDFESLADRLYQLEVQTHRQAKMKADSELIRKMEGLN